jgi:hypothetical protein
MDARKYYREKILADLTCRAIRKTYKEVERYELFSFTHASDKGFSTAIEMKTLVDALATYGDKVEKMEVDLSRNLFDDSAVPHIVDWLSTGIFPAQFKLNLSENRFSNLGLACIAAVAKQYDPKENWTIDLGGNRPIVQEGLFNNKSAIQKDLLNLLDQLDKGTFKQDTRPTLVA